MVCESYIEVDGVSKTVLSNEVEIEIVNVEVSPKLIQNIAVNTDGTTISVTETGAVDSREWYVTTTSGEGYESFDPAETGTDYTPNFANEGTYYVACGSSFSGFDIFSEEVTINVGASAINDVDANALSIYPNPTTGTFVINEEILTDYRVDVYNSQGKLVLSEEFNGTTGAQELVLEDKGIYIVNLVAPELNKITKLIVE